eukprot:TRINITY_DN4696_c0_g1_i2.p1 TRINITY_DN4696_c0_g1~~TRINITY_DN4696_c0_g1_i2.p1  ORF type:complete len:337 (-),score=60.37 TRINITY_DN4696_c0_g1_i2:182-1192(-)
MAVSAVVRSEMFQITSVDSLLGSAGERCVFGMLVRHANGRLALEDCQSSVLLDLSETRFGPGLFTDMSLVLAQGQLVDKTFVVSVLGQPPLELREDSLQGVGHLDFFGGAASKQEAATVLELEREFGDQSVVVVSDVHLDNPRVLELLRRLFQAYETAGSSERPHAIVLCGNFCSAPLSAATLGRMGALFNGLADLIASFPALASQVHWVFVPGPNDPGAPGNALPRPPLPELFTRRLTRRLATATFADNPCRLRFFSKEIVVCRQEIAAKMRRQMAVPPNEDTLSKFSQQVPGFLSELLPKAKKKPVRCAAGNIAALPVAPLPRRAPCAANLLGV